MTDDGGTMGPIDLGPRREWVPDIPALAAELLSDLAGNTVVAQIGDGMPFGDIGDLDAIGTFEAWEITAKHHGEELTPDDYQGLAIYLAKICLGQIGMPDLPPESV